MLPITDQRSLINSLQTLQSRAPSNSKAVIRLFGTYSPDHPSYSNSVSNSKSTPQSKKGSSGNADAAFEIEDPYYGGRDGFEECYKRCVVFAEGFLDQLEGSTHGGYA